MDIDGAMTVAHSQAVLSGHHDKEKTFGEYISLMHSELSEALEEFRSGRTVNEVWFNKESEPIGKPEGVPIELADTVIRIFDFCQHYKIDLSSAIKIKMEYNAKRPYLHGKVNL